MNERILYPAIDILGGRCVRLRQGNYGDVSAFGDDPMQVARKWQSEGATWLHVVDLDGARDGQPRHLDLLRAIAATTDLSIQYSGGLRTSETIAAALHAGAARVALGTAAVRQRALVQASFDQWGDRIAISVDVRAGSLAIAGWLASVSESVAEFADTMVMMGATTIIVTSVDRDGTLAGADDTLLRSMRTALPQVRLIGGGGVASLDDVLRLMRIGLHGVLLGRALYENALSLPEAIQAITDIEAEENLC
ncbi:MAG TPA: 1-(5-phosphoribosyl)-5-[(5-phosphoribosylamino)methylideneamino] imidazole-4-carboxamide isomerase [Ktedonobacterales bacterium]